MTLAVRDTDAGERAAAGIREATGNDAVHVGRVDLTDKESIAAFTSAWTGPLHILVNNAGVMQLPTLDRTPDGWELQFAANHLGHFALALGLHDGLAAAGDARIVSLSSRGHHASPVEFDDINFTSRPYDPRLGYGQSKTANVLFAVGATNRWAAEGITANAVHPGVILGTNLTRHMEPEQLAQLREAAAAGEFGTFQGAPFRFKSVAQGAATSVLVATSPQLDGIGGRYFEDNNEGRSCRPRPWGSLPAAWPRMRSTRRPPSGCGNCHSPQRTCKRKLRKSGTENVSSARTAPGPAEVPRAAASPLLCSTRPPDRRSRDQISRHSAVGNL